jgi:membrane-associated phospholipid phosphatase
MTDVSTTPRPIPSWQVNRRWEPPPVVGRPGEVLGEPIAERVDRWHPAGAAAATMVGAYLVLVALFATWGLLLVRVIVNNGRNQWDLVEWNRWFNERFTPTMDTWSGWFSRFGETLTIVGITAVVVIAMLVLRRWQNALFLVSALTLEVSVFLTMTLLVKRDRPPLPKPDQVPPTSSYPSGHTAAATALYLGLALLIAARLRNRVARTIVVLVGFVPGALVALARVARSMHHPTDVMTGYILGILSLLAAATVVAVAQRAADRRHGASRVDDASALG